MFIINVVFFYLDGGMVLFTFFTEILPPETLKYVLESIEGGNLWRSAYLARWCVFAEMSLFLSKRSCAVLSVFLRSCAFRVCKRFSCSSLWQLLFWLLNNGSNLKLLTSYNCLSLAKRHAAFSSFATVATIDLFRVEGQLSLTATTSFRHKVIASYVWWQHFASAGIRLSSGSEKSSKTRGTSSACSEVRIKTFKPHLSNKLPAVALLL